MEQEEFPEQFNVRQLIAALPYVGDPSHTRMKAIPVAVLNPGDGPDEQLLTISRVTWDDQLGVMRLEIDNG